jgi:ribosome-associated protein
LDKNNFRKLAKLIAQCLKDKKAHDIKILDVRGLSDIADYFIFATGTSTTHISGLAQEIKKNLQKNDIMPKNKEGYNRDSRWIVLDYFGVVVHICAKDVRDFYMLENMHRDAKEVKITSKKILKKDRNKIKE